MRASRPLITLVRTRGLYVSDIANTLGVSVLTLRSWAAKTRPIVCPHEKATALAAILNVSVAELGIQVHPPGAKQQRKNARPPGQKYANKVDPRELAVYTLHMQGKTCEEIVGALDIKRNDVYRLRRIHCQRNGLPVVNGNRNRSKRRRTSEVATLRAEIAELRTELAELRALFEAHGHNGQSSQGLV